MAKNEKPEIVQRLDDAMQLFAQMANAMNADVAKVTINEDGSLSLTFERKDGSEIDITGKEV